MTPLTTVLATGNRNNDTHYTGKLMRTQCVHSKGKSCAVLPVPAWGQPPSEMLSFGDKVCTKHRGAVGAGAEEAGKHGGREKAQTNKGPGWEGSKTAYTQEFPWGQEGWVELR